MKQIIIYLAAIIISMAGWSLHAAPTQVSGTFFGGAGAEEFACVRFAPDGTIVVVGNTSSSGSISGRSPTVLGTDGSTVSSTGFILRYASDGKSLLSYTRFAWGMTEIDSVAVDSSGIYVLGFATSGFANLISGLGGLDRTGPASGKKPFIAKLSTSGTSLIEGTYLAGSDSGSDELGIDIMSGGDVVAVHDNGGSDYISRLSSDLSLQRWRVGLGTQAGSSRPQGLVASQVDNKVYVVGYGMGNTTNEPLKGPYAFKFNGSNGAQEWTRTYDTKFPIWNWNPRDGDGRLNGLISDSTGRAIGLDTNGHPLIGGHSDGGATVFGKDPNNWKVDAPNLDGDGYWGFGSATSAGTIGKLDKNSHQWIRVHAIHPRCTGCAIFNRIHGVCGMASEKALWVGMGRDVPNVNPWYTGVGNAYIMKTKIDSTGTTREFVTHIPNVDVFNSCARNGTGNRYAIVGNAITTGAPTLSGVQTSYGGGTMDGYLVVMDDDTGGTTNPAPTVSITSPGNGATYTAPASITINAAASDSNGTVSNVQFLAGSTSLGTDTSSPYGLTWSSVAAGTHRLTARATDNGGAEPTWAVVNVFVNGTTGGGTVLHRINAGGAAVSPYTADANFSGGTAASSTATIDLSGVTSPAPAAVYQTERYGNCTYTFGSLTANTAHTVRLHFAETWHSAAGLRKFDVSINGTQVLNDYDVYAAAGAKNKAVITQHTVNANASGQIVIQFTNVVENAKINGIEIIRN